MIDATVPARRQSDDPLERFDTPRWMTAALLLKLPLVGRGGVIAPAAGSGGIVRVLREAGRRVDAYDLVPRAVELPLLGVVEPAVARQADATDPQFWSQTVYRRAAWCVTNPPFSLATLIRNFARGAGLKLGLLLRATALEPTEDRAPWLEADPPSDLILLQRGSFNGSGGGDTVPAFWFVWRYREARPGQGTRLHVVTPADKARLTVERAGRSPRARMRKKG
jgi:hypothetical protein